ncbi:hypothetical protein DPMN_189883 [Dreissena polymorpha]|uniref:Uncharacterized protein n=1 Tax=Dreissena polymorpha TaxID=45954 RepID=A0A9D4DWA2_DREPO|nr:hypothetical protein DPMN_189883 [Dreissena polymorpha]
MGYSPNPPHHLNGPGASKKNSVESTATAYTLLKNSPEIRSAWCSLPVCPASCRCQDFKTVTAAGACAATRNCFRRIH